MAVLLRNEHPKIIIEPFILKKKGSNHNGLLDSLDQEISILFMEDLIFPKFNKEFRNLTMQPMFIIPQNSEEDPFFLKK
ncbi:MAG: hypothetical protein CM1200mP16_15800 [Nitrospina sp.]|nr:MAG: hypothetical protein CM1200mP16_15800 [Nitrospina sp.]